MNGRFRKIFLFLGMAFGLSSTLLAYTSADYYNAGSTLFQAKNYSQAVPYFSAAIQLDPHNVLALRGRADSNYFLGQYASALADYQQVQALQPSDSMAQFIQGLQARVGSAAPASPAMMASAASGNPLDQGIALYKNQQYQAATSYFQQAIQQTPDNYLPYYWMGVDAYKMGDTRTATVYFTLADKKKPDPAVKAFSQKLWALLNQNDQQWVYEQLVRMTTSAPQPVKAVNHPFGIRLEPSIVLMNWADFNAQGAAGKILFGQLLRTDPNLVYTAEVPAGYLNLSIEPVLQLSPDLEIGLPLILGPIGSFTENLSSTVFGNQSSFQTFAELGVGLDVRYFLTPGSFRFFVAGGPMAAALGDAVANNSTNASYTASLGASGFGGQLQLGLDWHLENNFIISTVLGYQVLGMSPLTGTASFAPGQITEMYNNNTGAGYSLLYLTTNPASMPSGWRPVQVDLSGPFGGLTVSLYF